MRMGTWRRTATHARSGSSLLQTQKFRVRCARVQAEAGWLQTAIQAAKAAFPPESSFFGLTAASRRMLPLGRVGLDLVQVQVFTQRPRNGRIKLCNCANREIQLLDLVNFEKKNGSDRPFDVVSPPWLCILHSEWNVGTGQSPG